MILLLLPHLRSFHGVFNVFQYITFRMAMAALTSMVIIFVLGPWFIRTLKSLQFGQVIRNEGPDSHFRKAGTPTMGGLLIMVSAIVSILVWADLNVIYTLVLLIGMAGFSAIGLIDDVLKLRQRHSKGLSARGKFLLQIGLAAFLWWILHASAMPHLDTLFPPFFKDWTVALGILSLPFFVFVMVGTTNAVNLTDGLDGLAIGCSMIVAATYTILAYVSGNAIAAHYLQVASIPGSGELSVVCSALVGSALGFLWFNSHPAQIFMGDVGSLGLGGTIGLAALITKQELTLVIAGGVFVMEALSVILQVGSYKLSGRRVFLMAPFHHHFEKKGWDESKVVIRFWILSIICSLLALSTLKLR
ncbi:MAG TPA: phospho-N-acetylmuramoyl-pentapeptide-transferase [Thermoanaerobaculia bacterium]|nr:phospho-N-acetylmuramoyl-pentapeptide-transferase [Thermoanaerobaculia bacterium]HUM29345.1 phospho-N-acetylmuramoyl-pentapeptide-transferase [Thermoanaerobaculia bacterium]HXK67591.1 phospho-N-acetylmuramoyl-pentapeptide-transferase [Thermoanaerobaculia bacterium]